METATALETSNVDAPVRGKRVRVLTYPLTERYILPPLGIAIVMSATLSRWFAAAALFACFRSANADSIPYQFPQMTGSGAYFSTGLVGPREYVSLSSLHSALLARQEDQSPILTIVSVPLYGLNLGGRLPNHATTVEMLTRLLERLIFPGRGPCWDACVGACIHSEYCRAQERAHPHKH